MTKNRLLCGAAITGSLASAVVLLTALSGPASAADTDSNGFPIFPSIQAMPSLAHQSRITGASEQDTANALARPQPNSPAPPISREAVFAVGSTQYGGWEYMTTVGQTSTVGDHGGAQLRAVVQEVGYGGTPIATMAGTTLPQSANYENDAFCTVNGQYTSPCPAGYTVTGYYRYFNLDGYQGGTFTYRNTSLNSPFNTVSTQIIIK